MCVCVSVCTRVCLDGQMSTGAKGGMACVGYLQVFNAFGEHWRERFLHKFSNVSALAHLQHEITVKKTFQKFVPAETALRLALSRGPAPFSSRRAGPVKKKGPGSEPNSTSLGEKNMQATLQTGRGAAACIAGTQGPLLPHLRAAPMSRAPQTHRNADLVIGFFGLLPDEQVLLRICQLGDVLRAAHPAGSEYETGRGQRRERT